MSTSRSVPPSGRDLILSGAEKLGGYSTNPMLDAQLLLGEVTGTTRTHVMLLEEISPNQIATFLSYIDRRMSGEPIQYITGRAYFRNLVLEVGPGVLIPRPESEEIVSAVISKIERLQTPRVLDLGAGSGALAIAIAHEVSTSKVTAIEKDQKAFRWLTRNLALTKSSIEALCADVADFDGAQRFDAVIANPPYIPDLESHSDNSDIPDEVRNFEPHSALFGGKEGLEVPSIFIEAAARSLRAGGYLAIEHHESHGAQIAQILSHYFLEPTLHYDFNGRPRWSSGVRR